MKTFRLPGSWLLYLSLGIFSPGPGADDILPDTRIVQVADFPDLFREATEKRRLILLEVGASYCSFCMILEDEILKPMLRSGDYDDRVLIRKIEIDSFAAIRGFDGKPTTAADIAGYFDVSITPTLIFLNGQNQEVSERIIGVNSLDYFGGYLDQTIDQGLVAIR